MLYFCMMLRAFLLIICSAGICNPRNSRLCQCMLAFIDGSIYPGIPFLMREAKLKSGAHHEEDMQMSYSRLAGAVWVWQPNNTQTLQAA